MAPRNNAPQGRQGKPSGERQRPILQIQDGTIQGTVWMNQGDKGPWASISISRRYLDTASKTWKTATSFSAKDLLVVAEMARALYAKIRELNKQSEAQNHDDQDGYGNDDDDFGRGVPF